MAASIRVEGVSRPLSVRAAVAHYGRRGWPPKAIREVIGNGVSDGHVREALSQARKRYEIAKGDSHMQGKIARLWALDMTAEQIAEQLSIEVELVRAYQRIVLREHRLYDY